MRGKTWASIVIKSNYSAALKERVESYRDTSDYDILASEVDVFRDVSSEYNNLIIILETNLFVFADRHISEYLRGYLYESFQTFIQDYLETCEINKKVLTLPVRVSSTIFDYLMNYSLCVCLRDMGQCNMNA